MKKLCVYFILLACSFSFAADVKIRPSAGINLSAPQSEQGKVSASVLFEDIFKTSRPFSEGFYRIIRERIIEKGPESVGVELLKNEVTPLDLPLSEELADKYIYYYAQKHRTEFEEFGVSFKKDKTVEIKKGFAVHTRLLESARRGDVPDGVYSLYLKGDVSVKVSGIGKEVPCDNNSEAEDLSLSGLSNIYSLANAKSKNNKSGYPDDLDDWEEGLPDGFQVPKQIDLKNNCIKADVPEERLSWWRAILRWIWKIIAKILGIDTSQKQENIGICDEDVKVVGKEKTASVKTESHAEGDSKQTKNEDSYSPYNKVMCVKIKIPSTPDVNGLELSFKASKDTHLKDIKLLMPGADTKAILDGKISFNPAYIKYIEPFKVLRVMNLINASPRAPTECVFVYDKEVYQSWNNVDRKTPYGECLMKPKRTLENRAKLEDQTWGNSYLTPLEEWRGVPYEVLVELAKVTKAELWVNIPHNATEEYVTEMAKYFSDNLPKDQNVILELSNEIWNGRFWGQKYMIGLANDRKKYYEAEAVGQVENYVNRVKRFRREYKRAFKKYKKLKFETLENEMPYLDTYWNGYIDARRDAQNGRYRSVESVDRSRLRYNPDFLSEFNKKEIDTFESKLFKKYKKGYRKGKSHGVKTYDVTKEAEIHVKKRLLRAYQYIASLSYMDQVSKMHDLWVKAGFPEEHLATVVGTKQSNPGVTEIMLEYAKTKKYLNKIDGVAMGAYFYGCLGALDNVRSGEIGDCGRVHKGIMSVKSSSELLDVLEDEQNPKGVAKVKEEVEEHLENIAKLDKRIKILAYEGGHHLTTSLAKRPQVLYMESKEGREEQLLEIFQEAVESPRMGELTEELYKVWLESKGTVFVNFDMAHGYHKWGAFGLSQSVSDMETPRYRMATNYVEIFEDVNY